jgi:hypothetical protein
MCMALLLRTPPLFYSYIDICLDEINTGLLLNSNCIIRLREKNDKKKEEKKMFMSLDRAFRPFALFGPFPLRL